MGRLKKVQRDFWNMTDEYEIKFTMFKLLLVTLLITFINAITLLRTNIWIFILNLVWFIVLALVVKSFYSWYKRRQEENEYIKQIPS